MMISARCPPTGWPRMAYGPMSFAAGSPVRTLVTPGKVPDWLENDPAYGANMPGSLARYDHATIVAYPQGERWGEAGRDCERYPVRSTSRREALADANLPRLEIGEGIASHYGPKRTTTLGGGWWDVEPDVGRVAHGGSARVDRLRSLGNAVVPQIPELIGRAILAERQ